MKISLCKMYSDEEIKKTVCDIIDSGYYINGPQAKAFEKEFAEFIGAKHGISVSSGTSALFTVYMHLDIKPGDEIIVPSHTFIASITPAIILGATPVFVDIDPRTYTMDVDDVRRKISDKTKAIVCVHIYGHPVDMDPILEMAHEKSIKVIEDCAQAHGSVYKGKKIGTLGDYACFSFFPSKIMTVGGDGGMILTNNGEDAKILSMLKNHGRTKKYYHEIIGTNLRLAEIPAAIGRLQLKHLPEFVEKRKKIVDRYNEELLKIDSIICPIPAEWAEPAYYVYTIRVKDRDNLSAYLKEKGIATGIYYPVPVHKQPAITNKFGQIELKETEKVVTEILSLPLYPQMIDEDLNYILNSIKNYYMV